MRLDNYYYQPSSKFKLQSSDLDKIRSYEEKGLFPIELEDGTFLISIPSKAEVEFVLNGQRYSESVKNLIKDAYGMKKVTRKSLEKFYNDCNDGNINLDYSEKKGLYLV